MTRGLERMSSKRTWTAAELQHDCCPKTGVVDAKWYKHTAVKCSRLQYLASPAKLHSSMQITLDSLERSAG